MCQNWLQNDKAFYCYWKFKKKTQTFCRLFVYLCFALMWTKAVKAHAIFDFPLLFHLRNRILYNRIFDVICEKRNCSFTFQIPTHYRFQPSISLRISPPHLLSPIVFHPEINTPVLLEKVNIYLTCGNSMNKCSLSIILIRMEREYFILNTPKTKNCEWSER